MIPERLDQALQEKNELIQQSWIRPLQEKNELIQQSWIRLYGRT